MDILCVCAGGGRGGKMGFSVEAVAVVGGGVAGGDHWGRGEGEERKRGRGAGKATDIHENSKCVCVFFFPPLAVAIHRYVYRKTEGAGERRRRRQVKARGGAAHLAVDLQAIKVSVIFFPYILQSVCASVCGHVCVCVCDTYLMQCVQTVMTAGAFLICECFQHVRARFIYVFGCFVREQQAGGWATYWCIAAWFYKLLYL